MLQSDIRTEDAGTAGARAANALAVAHLEERLGALGLETSLRRIGGRFVSGGVSLSLCAAERSGSPEIFDSRLRHAERLLQRRVPVTLVLGGDHDASRDWLREVRERRTGFPGATGVESGLLGFCIPAPGRVSAGLRDALYALPGAGPHYVIIGAGFDDACRDSGDPAWCLLHDAARERLPVWPAIAAGVRSHCPLLAAESSAGIFPGSGIVAPLGSAWLPIDLDVSRYADASGRVCARLLDHALDACVELGERLLDCLSWFDPDQARDAHRNRRLAVRIVGLGDLVVMRDQDPATLGCLRELDRLVGSIHDGLWRRSRRLAEINGPLPALAEKQPGSAWHDERHRLDWQRRWRFALQSAQVRHRNLMVMSPYSILPRSVDAPAEFADLLPVLAHADALCFAEPPPLSHWNAIDFKNFFYRIVAMIERLNAASFIAAGV